MNVEATKSLDTLMERPRTLMKVLEEFQRNWVNVAVRIDHCTGHIQDWEAARIVVDFNQRLAGRRFRTVRPVSVDMSAADETLFMYCLSLDPLTPFGPVEIVDLDTGLIYDVEVL